MIIDTRSSLLLQRQRHALRIEHVSVSFATGKKALDDLSLVVPCGLCGVLGPDGAGKTTLLRIIAAEHPAGHGRIVYREIDPKRHAARWRSAVAYMPMDLALLPAVPVCVAVEHFAVLRGFSSTQERRGHVDAVLEVTALTACRGHHVGDLTPAESRRLAIAVALIGRPLLVLLDEPTAGLTQAERMALLELMSRVASTTLVLYTTSDPADIGDWCSQFVAIHRGRLLLNGAPDRLRVTLRGCVWSASVPLGQLDAIQLLHTVVGIQSNGDATIVRVICAHAPGVGFTLVEPCLSDVYHLYVPPRSDGTMPHARPLMQ